MNILSKTLLFIWVTATVFGYSTSCQASISPKELEYFHLTTRAYEQEAVRLMIVDANRAALKMQLSENLPITRASLVSQSVKPYGQFQFLKALGGIETSNYIYEVSCGQKLSHVEWMHLEYEGQWHEDYQWPLSRLDTNAPYQLATQWLAEASMDVKALDADCTRMVCPEMIYERGTNTAFVPIYTVGWTKKDREREVNTATVRLFLPKKVFIEMRVEDPKYMLGPPSVFTNIATWLAQTNR